MSDDEKFRKYLISDMSPIREVDLEMLRKMSCLKSQFGHFPPQELLVEALSLIATVDDEYNEATREMFNFWGDLVNNGFITSEGYKKQIELFNLIRTRLLSFKLEWDKCGEYPKMSKKYYTSGDDIKARWAKDE